MKFVSLLILSLTLTLPVLAQTKGPKLKPLLFQADKNNLQVLPQRFEYSLIDEDRLKVGNILIDTTQVTFQLEPVPQRKGQYRLHFTWPAGLLKKGELAIKNNSGKAIFTSEISPDNSKISKVAASEDEPELQLDVAEFTSETIDKSLVDDMKYFPFMTFCIYRESEETRIYLCSKELYLTAQGDQMVIKPRSASKKTALVEINGKVVGNQGMIYLNDSTENVSFKTQTQTGSFLEIDTRMKAVDFKDAVLSPDEKRVILTASGAEPVDESKVKKISETDWQVDLSRGRPLIYLKGEGDIPMRQEFYIRGKLPQEKDRPYLSAKSIQKTYSSTLSFSGVSPEGVQTKAYDKDPAAELQPTKKNQFLWTLRDIEPGEQRRYLTVQSGEDSFLVGYDISRGLPMALGISGRYYTPSGLMYANLDFQWWFENFIGMNSEPFRFHWGVQLERNQLLSKQDGEANADLTTVELLWRAQAGFFLQDETWGLSLPYQMIAAEEANGSAYGIGAFWYKKAPTSLASYMNWNEYKLQYFLGSTGDFKVSSAYVLSAKAYKNLSKNWNLRYGLLLSQYKFDPAAEKEDMQIGLDAGVLWQF
ncbi:hypothetical protein [Bdellovibrio sp. HCB2-146]|uniref:hypothetical protein n=1 Tax=Bdellovibrio sp. HCB2-146 TaxID=3394362 RepID=UPI0039BD46BA